MGEMKKALFVIFMFFSLVLSTYSKSQKSKASVEVIDGIECIHNTRTPMYPEKTVTFVEDLSIGGEDLDGNVILFNPRLSLVDENENIYISESKDHVIKVFGPNGKYIKTIGAKGSGPGEFQTMPYVAITKKGEIVVTDSKARRTSFFDSSGQFLKSFQWKTYYDGPIILIKSESYLTREIVFGQDRRYSWLYVKEIDFEGKQIQDYGGFTKGEPLIIRQSNKSATYAIPPVALVSIFTGDPYKELFYHCLNNKYIIEVYNTSGKLFRKIDRPYEPVPFTNKDAEEYRSRYKTSGEVDKKAIENMKMPKTKTIVVRMYVDDDSNLWVRTNEKKEDEDKILTAFDIFNPDGLYYARVWIEFTSLIFKKGKMYWMATDEFTGYKTLKRYKVVWD